MSSRLQRKIPAPIQKLHQGQTPILGQHYCRKIKIADLPGVDSLKWFLRDMSSKGDLARVQTVMRIDPITKTFKVWRGLTFLEDTHPEYVEMYGTQLLLTMQAVKVVRDRGWRMSEAGARVIYPELIGWRMNK